MKKIKAILSDFNGTLVDRDENFTPRTKFFIDKIKKKGIRFSIVTGRLYPGKVKEVETKLGIKGIHILHGGAKILDTKKNETLFYKPISPESVEKISKYMVDNKIYFALETEKEVFMSPVAARVSYLKNVVLKNLDQYDSREDVLKLLVSAQLNQFSEAKLDYHMTNIKQFAKDIEIIKFDFNGIFGVDVTSERATKHTAVLEYLKILDFDKEEVVGIGDDYNDYPLFTAVGFKIAMSNGPKVLKELSDLVVPRIEEGGMEEALKYVLDNLV